MGQPPSCVGRVAGSTAGRNPFLVYVVVIAKHRITVGEMVALNTDCAMLPESALDLGAGWVRFPRTKTAVPRRCPLWPETVQALRAILACRPKAAEKDVADRVFLTCHGNAWSDSTVSAEFGKVREKAKLPAGSPNFYALRHTFVTAMKKRTTDLDAIGAITGWVTTSRDDMLSVYDEESDLIDDGRLLAVTDSMREFLMPSGALASGVGEPADVSPFEAQPPAS
ncbi:MAG: tyrosine-type recombinase/integrase [Isosphaeraceae bacterium]